MALKVRSANAQVFETVSANAVKPSEESNAIPKILNIGSGKDFRIDALNMDISPDVGADIVADLSYPLINNSEYVTNRFGKVTLKPNMFNVILAFDVLEHIQNLTTAMTTCLELLEPNGTFYVQVPYDLSLGAWQDPTHIRAFNENSWIYYCDWYWYLGWKDWRFAVEELICEPTPFGNQLVAQGLSREEIMRTPRAIERMKVLLKKVPIVK